MRVLNVDDDDILRGYLGLNLEDAGHEVVNASDGIEAVDVLRSTEHLDCLIADFHLPGGIDGTEVVEHFQQRYPDAMVLVLTGDPAGAKRKLGGRPRCTCLGKPALYSNLLTLIERVVPMPTHPVQRFRRARASTPLAHPTLA